MLIIPPPFPPLPNSTMIIATALGPLVNLSLESNSEEAQVLKEVLAEAGRTLRGIKFFLAMARGGDIWRLVREVSLVCDCCGLSKSSLWCRRSEGAVWKESLGLFALCKDWECVSISFWFCENFLVVCPIVKMLGKYYFLWSVTIFFPLSKSENRYIVPNIKYKLLDRSDKQSYTLF